VRKLAVVLVVTSFATAVVACGDDSDEVEPTPRPENDFEALAEIFDPIVEPMGLELTRGSLVDLEGTYEESDTGNHMALYVEPINDDYTTEDYVNAISELTNELTSMIFEQYTAIDSYDICQEPPPDENDDEAPPPVTQVFITRDQSDAIEYPLTLEQMRALAAETPPGIDTIHVDPEIAKSREWKAAVPSSSGPN
jgi:hypothetical protein